VGTVSLVPAPDTPAAPDAPVSFEGSPEPVQEEVPLLDEVLIWLSRFICTMTDLDLDLLVLWVAHTWLCMETYTTPRLLLDSPVPGAGKTTVLEHLKHLCLNPVQIASLSSPALLTRMLDAGMRTVLIDEADRSLNPEKEGVAELLAVLNSGYKRGGTRPVLTPGKEGHWQVAEMPTFCPVAMAGNNPRLPDDTQTRTIRVLLLPDLEGQVEESDWEKLEEQADALGRRLGEWAEEVREQVRDNRPPLPDGITGRARERWSPLKRVAAAAGGRWPAIADQLALKDKEQTEMDREDGLTHQAPAVALLQHLRQIWPEGAAFVPTSQLLSDLIRCYPDQWGEGGPFTKALTAQRLGRMLSTAYKIHSTRLDRDGSRGYARSAFVTPWRRMGVQLQKQTGASGAAGESGASGRTWATS